MSLVDFPVKSEARPYLDAFEDGPGFLAPLEPGWLAEARRRAIGRFGEIGFPDRKSESWRYLDLQPLIRGPLLPTLHGHQENIRSALTRIDALELPPTPFRLIIVDGVAPALDPPVLLPKGVWFGATDSALAEDRGDLLRAAAAPTPNEPAQPFALLNRALFCDGFVLDVAAGTVLDAPVEVVHLASDSAEGSFHTRSVIRLGAGARVTVIETYAGDRRYWRNDVLQVQLGAGAGLTHIAVVEESSAALHLGLFDATLGTKSKLDGFMLLLGGGTVRHEANITLAGDNAECRLDGSFVVSGREEANIVTTIDHNAVGGTTSELIKGVAAGRGHGAFQGKIIVREGAQQTDARQTSRNLILGRRAVIDTKPELEILADDVKCAHGASVGDLDEAALFYLRARGIPTDEARRLLVEGFLREPVEGIADPVLREHLLRRLSQRLARLESE